MNNNNTKIAKFDTIEQMESYLLNENPVNEINQVVHKNRKNLYQDLNDKLTQSLSDILSITEKIEKNGMRKSNAEANKVLENISQTLEYFDDVFETDVPVELQHLYSQISSKYRKLEYQLFNYKFESMKSYNSNLKKEIEKQTEILKIETDKSKQMKIEQKKLSEEIFSKIESIGATTLNMILTISLVTSSVAVITQIENPIYIPMFILAIVWILLTCIIFNAGLFKSDVKQINKTENKLKLGLDNNTKLCMLTYIILSIGTILCIVFTCLKTLL